MKPKYFKCPHCNKEVFRAYWQGVQKIIEKEKVEMIKIKCKLHDCLFDLRGDK